MANLSLRMLTLFLLAAFLLNISNYLFIRFYNLPRDHLNYYYPKTASGLEVPRSPINTEYWAVEVQCTYHEKSPSTSRPINNYSKSDSKVSHNDVVLDKTETTETEKNMEYCPELPPGLDYEITMPSFIRNMNELVYTVQPGGIYEPTTCKSRQSVAILIAYRGLKSHLTPLLITLNSLLIKQQMDYQIFVFEQKNITQPYNRGKLFNVAFKVVTRLRKTPLHCIVIHEPNIVPLDSRNLYRCSWYPKQLATKVFRQYRAPYMPLLGGAVAMTPEQYVKVNGFSNAYWANEADYLDLYYRINKTKYLIDKSIPLVGSYETIMRSVHLWTKSVYLANSSQNYLQEGLSSITYTVESFQLKPLYTYVQVHFNVDAAVESESKSGTNPITSKNTKQEK